MSEVYIGISRTDGSVAHYAFQTEMRSSVAPKGPWRLADNERWARESSDENIEFDVARLALYWGRMGDPLPVGWRRLSLAEHEQFNQDRDYRDALEDVGGKIQHNMPKARDLHRACLRHKNGDKFMQLDREWVNCSAVGDKQGADAVEAKRKALRDFVTDPRIDNATNLDELKRVTPNYTG